MYTMDGERIRAGLITRTGGQRVGRPDLVGKQVVFALRDDAPDNQKSGTSKHVWYQSEYLGGYVDFGEGTDKAILFPLPSAPLPEEGGRTPEEWDRVMTESAEYWSGEYDKVTTNILALANYIHDRLIEMLVAQNRITVRCYGGVVVGKWKGWDGSPRYGLYIDLKESGPIEYINNRIDLSENNKQRLADALRLVKREDSHSLLRNIAKGK